MPDVQNPGDKILHQDSVEAVIADQLDGPGAGNAAIDDLVAITGGQAPTETQHNLVLEAVNDILTVLRNSGVIPAE